jgi:hypothetical protein
VSKVISLWSILVILSLLSGCWGFRIPIDDAPHEYRDAVQSLDSLIGYNAIEVVNVLGEPRWVVTKNDKQAEKYIYQWWSKLHGWLWVLYAPTPVFPTGDESHCILVAFGDDGRVVGYEVESWSTDDCLNTFEISRKYVLPGSQWETTDPEMLKALKEKASKGDSASQFKLYLSDKNNPQHVKWICRLADMGHTKSQMEVSRIYTLRNAIINNRSKSYMWQMRAARSNESRGRFHDKETQERAKIEVEYKAKSVLTEVELNTAKQLQSQWQKGQCERDLVPPVSNE